MDLINIAPSDGIVIAILGYCVVFIGLILLMIVVSIMAKIFISRDAKAKLAAEAAQAAQAEAQKAEPADLPKAEGTAGDLKLYDTDPRDAAMIMAIVADSLGVPLNELRFKSIREVK